MRRGELDFYSELLANEAIHDKQGVRWEVVAGENLGVQLRPSGIELRDVTSIHQVRSCREDVPQVASHRIQDVGYIPHRLCELRIESGRDLARRVDPDLPSNMHNARMD
ncbi:hypothetical protein [Blastococcus sp. CT_GayMR20]|uniref:hypothetical protein n=1 Tax=Blastococcus sp. CT_GayMR20 TaxID=2559609 RepID=UPI001FD805FB|nr:hypothetical protein [Blastococcus sp. CT_GayMR20]